MQIGGFELIFTPALGDACNAPCCVDLELAQAVAGAVACGVQGVVDLGLFGFQD